MKTKGTIFYLGGFDLPNKNAAAHRVVANGKILRSLGFDVIFVGVDTTRTSGGLKRSAEDYFDFECWSVPYPNSSIAWVTYLSGSSQLIALLKQERPSTLVGVICYNYPAIAQLRIHALCRRLGIKHLADATEWYDTSAGSVAFRIIKTIDVWLRMWIVHRRADALITTSQFMSSFYRERGKLVVELPTLFDKDKFPGPKSRDSGKEKRYIYVGIPFHKDRVNKARTNLKERLDIAIDLFHRLYDSGQEFAFDIYGIDKKSYLDVFPEHTEVVEKLANAITFHGRQTNDFVLSRVAESDFSVFFRDETRMTLAGFPSKAAESISCGTPVITNELKSLERYRNVPGMFLAKQGLEFALIERLNGLSDDAIQMLKDNTYCSRAFDYRRFEVEVSEFLDKAGIY